MQKRAGTFTVTVETRKLLRLWAAMRSTTESSVVAAAIRPGLAELAAERGKEFAKRFWAAITATLDAEDAAELSREPVTTHPRDRSQKLRIEGPRNVQMIARMPAGLLRELKVGAALLDLPQAEALERCIRIKIVDLVEGRGGKFSRAFWAAFDVMDWTAAEEENE